MRTGFFAVWFAVAAMAGPVDVIAPAMPHGDLKSSVPRDKARLTKIPKALRLTFTEAPELALTKIKLRAPGGQEVALGKLTVTPSDKATVVAPITGTVSAGTYTVEWEMTGEDGHPVDGKFGFTVMPEAIATTALPAAAPQPAAPTPPQVIDTARLRADRPAVHHDTISMPTSATRFDSESGGYVIVRFALYIALLIVVGAVAFRTVVLALVRRRPDVDPAFIPDAARRAASIGRMAAWLLLVACLARLAAQSLALNGTDAMMDSSRLGVLVGGTRWGRTWMVQLVATIAALYGFTVARRRDADPARAQRGWSLALGAALVLAFTPGFTSHAAALQRFRPLAMLFDGLHISGAAGWLGSLFVVLAAGIPAALALREDRRGPAVADLIGAFSPTALMFAGLVAITGLFAAWLHLGAFAALWQASYGQLLFSKLAVLSVVALTGAYNWLRVKPTLGTVEGAARIRRSATVEVVVGVIVVIITAMLVATPPPMDKM